MLPLARRGVDTTLLRFSLTPIRPRPPGSRRPPRFCADFSLLPAEKERGDMSGMDAAHARRNPMPDRRMKSPAHHWPQGAWFCCLIAAWAAAGFGALRAQAPGGSDAAKSAQSTISRGTLRLTPESAEMIEDPQSLLSDDAANLRREGTHLREERGRFDYSGDRVTFTAADRKTRFVVLENLNLQRIVQILSGSGDSLEWTVNGVITEFQGMNFLLVTRATRATATSERRRSF